MSKIKGNPPSFAIEAAIREANKSPCQKSKRGVVLFKGNSMFSSGFNHPPGNHICAGSQECQTYCAKLCVHAEQEALMNLNSKEKDLEMLHVKTKEGSLVSSKDPSCWQCSRLVLSDKRVSWFWLYHEEGWFRYPTPLFHSLTLSHCQLPIFNP